MATHFQRQDSVRSNGANHNGVTHDGANQKVMDHLVGRLLHGPTFDRSVAGPEPSSSSLRPPFPPAAPLAPATGAGNGEPQSTRSAFFHCPGCDSPQTQRVSVIFDAIKSQSQSRKSRGELTRCGNILWGTLSDDDWASTRSMQQSQLAKRFAPPEMDCERLVEAGRSRVAAAGGGALVAFLIVMIPLIVLGNKPPAAPSAPDVQQPDTSNFARALTIIAALALFGVPILVFTKISARFDAKIARLRQDEWEAFDWKKRAWKNSFYCHRCDSIFNPASRPEA